MQGGVQRHAFWFYALLVALGIEQALTAIVPRLFQLTWGNPWPYLQEAGRLVVFLLVSMRLLLRIGPFLDEVHRKEARGHFLIFLVGFLQLLGLFAWALAIDPHEVAGLSFPILLGLLLSYDLVWLVLMLRRDRNPEIHSIVKSWTVHSLAALSLAGLAYGAMAFSGSSLKSAEMAALAAVWLVILVELGELADQRT
jgi:hypothetical protein